jgi:hypothetical protein
MLHVNTNGKPTNCITISQIISNYMIWYNPYLPWNYIKLWLLKKKKKTKLWPEFTSELYRPSDLLLTAKLAPAFADRGCHVVSVTVPYCHILDFLDWSRYFIFQVAPQFVSDPLLLRKSGSAGIRTRTSDHRGSSFWAIFKKLQLLPSSISFSFFKQTQQIIHSWYLQFKHTY